jgi:hypothetical protein
VSHDLKAEVKLLRRQLVAVRKAGEAVQEQLAELYLCDALPESFIKDVAKALLKWERTKLGATPEKTEGRP